MKTNIDLLKELVEMKGKLLPDEYVSFNRNVEAIIKQDQRYTNEEIDAMIYEVVDKLLQETQERITQDNNLNDKIIELRNELLTLIDSNNDDLLEKIQAIYDELANLPIALKDVTYDAENGNLTFTYTDEDKPNTIINIPKESFLENAEYDHTTNILTLTLSDGSTFEINLVELIDMYDVAEDGGLVLSNDLFSIKLDSTSTPNVLTLSEDGLKINLDNYYNKNENNLLLNSKQDILVSGVNIKTINYESILGSGNIDISGGGSISGIIGGRNYLYESTAYGYWGTNSTPRTGFVSTTLPFSTTSTPITYQTMTNLKLVNKEVTFSADLHRAYTGTTGYIYFQFSSGAKIGSNVNISVLPLNAGNINEPDYYKFKHTFTVPSSAANDTEIQCVLVNVSSNAFIMFKNVQLEIGGVQSDYKKPMENYEANIYQQINSLRSYSASSLNYFPQKIMINESINETLFATNPIQNIDGTNYFDCFESNPKVWRSGLISYDNDKINNYYITQYLSSTYPNEKFRYALLWFDNDYNLIIPQYYNFYWNPISEYSEVKPDTMMIWDPEELKRYRYVSILIKDKDDLDLPISFLNEYPLQLSYGGGFKTAWSPSIKDTQPLKQIITFDFNQSKSYILPNNCEFVTLKNLYDINNVYINDIGDTSTTGSPLIVDEPYRFTKEQFEAKKFTIVCDGFGGVVELEFY